MTLSILQDQSNIPLGKSLVLISSEADQAGTPGGSLRDESVREGAVGAVRVRSMLLVCTSAQLCCRFFGLFTEPFGGFLK